MLWSIMSTIEGCFIEICYCKIMERLLSETSWVFLRHIRLLNKCKGFIWFSQMHLIWLWKLLICFQNISLRIILKLINLVLKFWIIPRLVFTVIRRCRKNEEVKHGNRQRPHEILNQGCGRWGTSGIAIANLYLLHTVVVYYRNSSFKMRKFSSNKFNLDFSR